MWMKKRMRVAKINNHKNIPNIKKKVRREKKESREKKIEE